MPRFNRASQLETRRKLAQVMNHGTGRQLPHDGSVIHDMPAGVWCFNPAHATPCPQPCDGCSADCEPTLVFLVNEDGTVFAFYDEEE